MTKVAVVVQRCHPSIAGGSEALAWQYAGLLGRDYDVEVLTTTALDYRTWAGALSPGQTRQQGITVGASRVALGRTAYWHALHQRFQQEYAAAARPWTPALQEEFLRHQGPYAPSLLEFLEQSWPSYQALLFVSYLYPTTYFGLGRVPPDRCLLVPTLHDEPIAYLSVFRQMARRVRGLLWLTAAEQRLGRTLWGELPGRVVAMAVATELTAPAQLPFPYVLYCGRLDPMKRVDELIQFFLRFKQRYASEVRLVLTGDQKLEVPRHPAIEYRGVVPEAEKFALMAGAACFLMPSPYESFSVATLEAMAQRRPVLVNGACDVLEEHVRHSGGGRVYRDAESFCHELAALVNAPDESREMGARARDYVLSRYRRERIQTALLKEVEACAARA